MQVKQRLRINTIVSIVSVLAILVVFALTLVRVNKALESSKIADAIMTASFERLMLRTDLHRTGSERSKVQLLAKHTQIGDLLKTALEKFSDPEDKKTVSELLTNHEAIGKFSKTIRENREKRGPRARSDELSREIEDRLLSQLNMRVYETILLGTKLQESGTQAFISSLKLAGGGILFVLLLVSAAIVINSWTISHSITDRIARLQNGALLIGSGKLDHHIDVKGDDELAALSASFNAMSEKLSDSYSTLESEIKAHKKTEELLHKSEQQLTFALETIHTGAWNLDLVDHTAFRSLEHDRIFGYTEMLPQWTYEMFLEHILPEDRPEVDAKFRQAIATKGDWNFECRIRRIDGENRWILAAGRHLPDASGDRRRMSGIVQDITERKRAEEALRNAHDELEMRVRERAKELYAANAYNRILLEASLDPLVTIGNNGKIMDVNAAAEAATGHSRAELVGTDFSEYFTEPEKARAGYEQVFREGAVRDYALELRHQAGHTTPVLYNAAVYSDENGNVLGVFAAARDITIQKQAEEALSNLNKTLEQRIIERTAELHAVNETLRASRVAALNLMEDAVIARKLNEEKSKELGLEILERKRVEEALVTLNKDLENRVFQRTRLYSVLATVNATIVRQRDQQALFDEVCRIIVQTGGFKLAWVGLVDPESREVRAVASYGATGYLEGIRIVASDLPEGRGPTGTSIIEGRHITTSDFETDEKVTPWRERARGHGIRSSSAFPLLTGNRVSGALTIYSEQPGFFDIDEVALLLSLSENLSFAIAAFEAEQSRLAAVDALRALNENLEQRVARRTAELEFSNKELEAFIYSVSHDLRAPVRHISGFSKIMAEDYADTLDEQARDYLARIMNGAERMSQLIEDLLRLSRISRQDMEREEVNISAIVSSLVAEFYEAHPDEKREIIIKDQVFAAADRRLIKLALQNLVDNAWKFTSKTQNARIEFDAFQQQEKMVYCFRDNGVGFDPAYAEKMFLPFHRLHTESEFQGTGIGLAIVERVIHRHGGKIWAEGEPGKGATVYFTLN
jgi:PAS domain S-box-containing protein